MNNVNNYNVNNIEDFIKNVKDVKQQLVLVKLKKCSSFYKEYNLYLVDTYISKEFNSLDIKILGGNKKSNREIYIIKIPLSSLNLKLTCSCKAYTYKQKCKHLLFLVCVVCKIFDYNYLEKNILSNEDINSMIKTLHTDNHFVWDNHRLSIKNLNSSFKKSTKPFLSNELCPICYEKFNVKECTVSCPDCNNHVHFLCVNKWLQYSFTCVYCRSVSWINYKLFY